MLLQRFVPCLKEKMDGPRCSGLCLPKVLAYNRVAVLLVSQQGTTLTRVQGGHGAYPKNGKTTTPHQCIPPTL